MMKPRLIHFGRFRKRLLRFGLLVAAGLLAGGAAGVFLALTHDLPQIRSLENWRPSAVTRIYSADHELLAELYAEKRTPVPLAAIPPPLKTALLTTEDRNFYRHCGVDIKGIIRAAVKDIMAGEFVEGASTLTQQLAKTLFLSPEKSLIRKVREAWLAFQLERRYTKDEILSIYLNQIYLGSGAYGVEAAARIFFGKSLGELTLAECALIAGMPQAPSRYSPLVNPELAVKRRNVVLGKMLATGNISRAAYEAAVEEPLAVQERRRPTLKAPYFVAWIKDSLEAALGADLLYHGGLTVHTTLNHRLQQAAENAMAKGLEALARRMANSGNAHPDPQAALVALDLKTGGILSMVGGRDFRQSPYNRAVTARRQPGSAFKPLVYAYAVEQGFAPHARLLDTPVAFKSGRGGEDWLPENFSRSYDGEVTLRYALAKSKNIPAVRLIEKLGPASVAAFAHRLGIDSPLNPVLSLALGSSEVTLLELTAAYGVFPNQGMLIRPFGVAEVLDRHGRVLWQARPRKQIVMSAGDAAVVTDMLEGVIQEGTGRRAKVLSRRLGGKTGTTDDCRDALFIGFSPAVAAGVWVGRDSAAPLGAGETGARAALPIWIDFMASALEEKPAAAVEGGP